MSLSVQQFKSIGKKCKYAVYGYIRNVQSIFPSNNPYYNIPNEISFICICYYSPTDEWDPLLIGPDVKIDGNSVIHLSIGYQSAYLSNIVSTGINIWKFSLNKVSDNWNIIGVTKTKYKQYVDNTFVMNKNDGYGYLIRYMDGLCAHLTNPGDPGNAGKKYGSKKLESGDIIEVILDLNKLCLSYKVNDIDLGVAFKNIEKTTYRAAVTFYNKNEKISFISYTIC